MPSSRLGTRVPPGCSGAWRIEHFEVPAPAGDVSDRRPAWARDEPGRYTQLVCGDELYMTDLAAELHTQRPAIEEARERGGRILITGLGLGVVVEAMLAPSSTNITEIVVVERSPDVVALVGPYLVEQYGSTVRIVTDDAFDYVPVAADRFTVGWHDIWPVPQAELALAQSHALIRRFAEVCDWQGAWPLVYRDAEALASTHGDETVVNTAS
jgi:hypothetical protein